MSHAILPETLETLRTYLETMRLAPTNPNLHDGAQIGAIIFQQ